MGGGSWSDADYRKATKGMDAFGYSRETAAKSRDQQKCHQALNPFKLKVRESRDSAEHPESNAIMIGLDVTGSMSAVVVAIQSSLGRLMTMLLKGKYVSDPQLLFYAIGDATCDQVPLQISQFESDNRINDQLTKAFLEGGGGGQNTESYELGFLCAGRFTSIDCMEKRSRKGYLFSIGDERPYSKVSKDQVKAIMDASLQGNIPTQEAVDEAKVKYNVFHIIPKGSNLYGDAEILRVWKKLLGGDQFVIILEDPDYTAETIALAIGLNEGSLTLDEGVKLVEEQSGSRAAEAVRKALEFFAAYAEKNIPKKAASSAKKPKNGSKKGKDRGDKKDVKDKKDKENWKL